MARSGEAAGARARRSEWVGFIGLGAMGRPMAEALIAGGHRVIGFDLSRASLEAFARSGGTPSDSAAEVAARSRIVFTMLPYSEDVRAALLGPGGAHGGARPDTVFVEASTIDPLTVWELERAMPGALLLDAGVAGSPRMARERRVTLIVGGDRGVLDRSRSVLEAFTAGGGRILYSGPLGTGKVVKLVNNMVGGVTMAVVAEAFNLARKAGVDAGVLHEAMLASMARCHALEVRPPYPGLVEGSPADQGFAPDFPVSYMAKDLRYATEAGRELRAPLLFAALAHQLYVSAEARGDGALDFSAVIRSVEALSGTSADVG